MKVWIAAMAGDVELDRKSILVWPVHTWWTNGHQHGPGQPTHPPDNADFWNDYDFLRWKYAAVLATTGGAFEEGGVTISTDTCVPCGLGIPPPCVAACTDIDDTVAFGTSAFAQSENAGASIIGHELVHTTGTWPLLASECEAYTWEVDHSHGTGIWECDVPYLEAVLGKKIDACGQK